MHVADRLSKSIETNQSIACVGLDPRPHLIPPQLQSHSIDKHGNGIEAICDAFLSFNQGILDAVAGHCAAIKPQVACYEAYGWRGMQVLEASIAYAKKLSIPVIVDGKRNDIGSTATHYQQAWLGDIPIFNDEQHEGVGADWLTVNGYLGSDGINPFLDDENEHGIFVLVKTSNPSSGELQSQESGETSVMEAMAKLVNQWGSERLGNCGLSDVGAVVGATYPEEAKTLRQHMPHAIFLVPGYGAQGGSAAEALAGIRTDGQGVLVNASRSINGAWQTQNDAAKLERLTGHPLPPD